MAGLRIGINGGGVGGMAAAIALRQAGHDGGTGGPEAGRVGAS